LAPAWRTFDRARDRGQRRPQLVRRIGDELALALLAALPLGDVDQDEDRRGLRPAGKPLQAKRAVVGADERVELLRAGVVQAGGKLAERRLRPRVGELRPDPCREQLLRGRVREYDLEVLVDREDALVQPREQPREAVLVEPAAECAGGASCHGASIPGKSGPNRRAVTSVTRPRRHRDRTPPLADVREAPHLPLSDRRARPAAPSCTGILGSGRRAVAAVRRV
jgi:hypothetical protein